MQNDRTTSEVFEIMAKERTTIEMATNEQGTIMTHTEMTPNGDICPDQQEMEKQPYETPRVTVLGTVAQLTQATKAAHGSW